MAHIRQTVEQSRPRCKVLLKHAGVTAADGFTVQDLELEEGAELIGVVMEADLRLSMHGEKEFEVTVPGSASLADLKKACGWSSSQDVRFTWDGRVLPTEGPLSEAGLREGAVVEYEVVRPWAPAPLCYMDARALHERGLM
eukprot:CAMPEP_0197913168 /NCGR_PEP_ID=MMETSP1439-20131203/76167_1 /TAXON_ID=66791 /ORGANISM="Gonyaulax spinifera, Strain CCMP409" /LENGTH=140 /DNA_ID=CAMNT_0043535003 /DNA_START=144 /DNA_END=566 /DNA_ORIENTATION=+